MFSIFRRNRDTGPSVSPLTVPGAVSASPKSGQTAQNPDVQRELVRVVLKNVLRKHGVASEWMTCEVFQAARPSGRLEPRVELILRVWNQPLLLHTNALARHMAQELARFDPINFRADRAVSWRLASDCTTPFDSMPAPETWTQPVAAASAEQPIPILDRRKSPRAKDAPVVRRNPDAGQGRSDGDSDGFEATAVSPLS
jgi:hypothetical protein